MVAGEFLAAILITSTCSIILLAFGDECYHPASLGNPFFFFFCIFFSCGSFLFLLRDHPQKYFLFYKSEFFNYFVMNENLL